MPELSVYDVIKSINNEASSDGGYWLPNIQRDFVWGPEKIVDLFDSVLRGYPIGSILVWKTGEAIKKKRFLHNFTGRSDLSSTIAPETHQNKLLILDGQQRLQSLLLGLRGAYEGRELFINLRKPHLKAEHERFFNIAFHPEGRERWPWIRLRDITNAKSSIDNVLKGHFERNGKPVDKITNQDKLLCSSIRSRFLSEKILHLNVLDGLNKERHYSNSDIVKIFVRVNSKGTQLKKSELLHSILVQDWKEGDERIDAFLTKINGNDRFSFTKDFLYKVCLVLTDEGAAYDIVKFHRHQTKKKIVDNWDDITSAIASVRDYMVSHTHIKSGQALPSYNALIPLIYFRYKYPSKFETKKNLHKYLLRVLLGKAFSGNPDRLIDRSVDLINEHKDFNISAQFSEISNLGRNIHLSEEVLFSILYGQKYIHLILNILYPNYEYNTVTESYLPQIDHIFPQSELKSQKKANKETGRNSIRKYSAFDINQLANCMLVRKSYNLKKSWTSPEDWFPEQIRKDRSFLRENMLPSDKSLWNIRKYPQFVEARKALILKRFKSMGLLGELEE